MHKLTIISLFALFLAVAALVISLIPRQPSEAEIDKLIDAGLQRKEHQYVQALAPKMERIYKDMIYPYTPPAKQPETLGELFLPLMKIVTGLQSDTSQQPAKAEQGAAANP